MLLKQKQLFFLKAFFGSMIRNWNPENQPFISGVRFRVHILDLAYSNFHLRKFLFLVYYASQKRLKTCFYLRAQYSKLYPLFVPFAYYAPHWVGGVLSNFRSVRRHYNLNKIPCFIPRSPDLAVFLNDLSRMDYMVNEGFVTRTPFVFFGDSSTNLQRGVYSVGGKISDLASASFISMTILSVIKRGRVRTKLNFRRTLRRLVKREFKRRFFPSKYYSLYAHYQKELLSSSVVRYVKLLRPKRSKYFRRLPKILKNSKNFRCLMHFFSFNLNPLLGSLKQYIHNPLLNEDPVFKLDTLYIKWIRKFMRRPKKLFRFGKGFLRGKKKFSKRFKKFGKKRWKKNIKQPFNKGSPYKKFTGNKKPFVPYKKPLGKAAFNRNPSQKSFFLQGADKPSYPKKYPNK